MEIADKLGVEKLTHGLLGLPVHNKRMIEELLVENPPSLNDVPSGYIVRFTDANDVERIGRAARDNEYGRLDNRQHQLIVISEAPEIFQRLIRLSSQG